MSGRNAKTNFPIPKPEDSQLGKNIPATVSNSKLSDVLSAKLRKCCKTPSPSLTCLRLDTENSHIGVWQKRAGASADSNWVMTVQLGRMEIPATNKDMLPSPSITSEGTSSSSSSSSQEINRAAAASNSNLSDVLSAKLRKCCKTPSPSLTCLRLDTENSNIGVWQKRAGTRADSNWVMTVQLNKMDVPAQNEDMLASPSVISEGTSSSSNQDITGINDEDRLALQMVEELLNGNSPTSSSHDAFLM